MGPGSAAARDLDWDGCVNVRDLGGLTASGGGTTRRGAVVRMDNPARLTPAGWVALRDHGIRTVLLLRTAEHAEGEEPDVAAVPPGIGLVRLEIEDLADVGFVEQCVDTGIWCTPLYFRAMLDGWPERCALAVSAVAAAPSGGVVVSCGRGADRTGLVAFLLLALVGVGPREIAADWHRSLDRLWAGDADTEAAYQAVMDREGATVAGTIAGTLRDVDIEQRLLGAGLTPADLTAIRGRLRSPGP